VLQAAIASLYAEPPTYEETDWSQILQLYDALLQVWPSPVVALNRCVALSMVAGPQVALDAVQELEQDPQLTGYRYVPAIKADLLRRLGRIEEAVEAYRAALALTDNESEREFLAGRIADPDR
jgi:RNA polymerase sigma-70 factor (ECF subfamily)